jgi:chromosomal replication initiator protein
MNELWTEAVRSIEPMVKPAHRDLWLRPIECMGIDEGRIRLRAPNRYHKEWFEDNFLPPILRDLESRAHRSFVVDFEVADEIEPSASAGVVSAPRPNLPRTQTPPIPAPPPNLVTRYTFDKFVVGPTNQFAHAAARMVAEAPASRWNPLFIYGGVGLGKTHLLQAIGHEIHQQHPDWVITFVTCEGFVTDFIGSMMNQKRQSGTNLMEEFRTRYRE